MLTYLTNTGKTRHVVSEAVVEGIRAFVLYQGTRSGHLGKIVPIDTVLGGKSFDKARPLTTSIAASATATAKIAPGYALAGYTALESDVGPVAGLSSMNWKEATSTSAPVTPTPVTTTAFYNNNVVKENEKQSCQSNNSCKGTPTAEQRISSFTKAGMAGSNAFSFLGALGISQPMIIVGADTASGLIDYATASYVAVLLIIIITISILIIAFKRKRD